MNNMVENWIAILAFGWIVLLLLLCLFFMGMYIYDKVKVILLEKMLKNGNITDIVYKKYL
jgi:hypothetical protein